MSLRKRLFRLLSVPVHVHVNLPFNQALWLKLDTLLDYYAEDDYERAGVVFQGLGVMFNTDGPRTANVQVGAGLLGLGFGVYQRYTGGGC